MQNRKEYGFSKLYSKEERNSLIVFGSMSEERRVIVIDVDPLGANEYVRTWEEFESLLADMLLKDI
ncbi:MAG: hypothetical protein P0116_14390 [Candidatus Nitrosocosmicus sp.]|nr:hypothetical protein [Candidatus Nitrosocosmicus sp.]